MKGWEGTRANELFSNDSTLIVHPQLATKIGLPEAIVLRQVHYWLSKNAEGKKNERDGHHWTFRSMRERKQKDFPFWSEKTVGRAFNSLREKGLLVTENFNKQKYDRTLWYRINYGKLEALLKDIGFQHKPSTQNGEMEMDDLASPLGQNGEVDAPEMGGPIPEKMGGPIPEIKKETKKEKKPGELPEKDKTFDQRSAAERFLRDHLPKKIDAGELDEWSSLPLDYLQLAWEKAQQLCMRNNRKPSFAFMDLLQGKEVNEELHREKQCIEENRLRERGVIAAKTADHTYEPGEIVQLSTGKFEAVYSQLYAGPGLLYVRRGSKRIPVDEVKPTGLKVSTIYEVLNHEVYDYLQIEGFDTGSDNRLRIVLFDKDGTSTLASITLERLWELFGPREELRPF